MSGDFLDDGSGEIYKFGILDCCAETKDRQKFKNINFVLIQNDNSIIRFDRNCENVYLKGKIIKYKNRRYRIIENINSLSHIKVLALEIGE